MDVEMVGDQHEALGLGEVLINQGAQGMGHLAGGAGGGDADVAPAEVGSTGQKQIDLPLLPVASVLRILAGRTARGRTLWGPHIGGQHLARLIQTDQGSGRIGRTLVDGQHILHGRHKGGVVLRRDYPRPLPPGLQIVFFSVARTVSGLMDSTTASSTSRLPSSRRLQRA